MSARQLVYAGFQFQAAPVGVSPTAHRTGDNQGQAVSESVQQSGDPSQYVVLVDDYYTREDGALGLTSDTADIPNASTSEGDADLARISLGRFPTDVVNGKYKILLSDPTAVRLFKPDGTLFYEYGKTDDGVLTLDASNPSGYLAGLLSGDLDVWVEGVRQSTDFDFAIVYEDDSGAIAARTNVHMSIADWTFRGYDGRPLYDVEPIWGQALLAALQEADALGVQGLVGEIPEDYFYKNSIEGLPSYAWPQIQVASLDDPSESYVDELLRFQNGAVSTHFGALYGSEEIFDADPDPTFTSDQRAAILNALGLNVAHNPGEQLTLKTGPTSSPWDSFTRELSIKPLYTITLDDPDGVYHVGDRITGTITMNSNRSWDITIGTSDGQTAQAASSKQLRFDFVANKTGYIVLKASAVRPWVDPDTPGVFNESVLIRILPQGQSLPPWQEQAWLALKGADNVPGDAINRNRRITALYADMYNGNPDVFKWAGMAAFASKLVGDGLVIADVARRFPGIWLIGPDPNLGYRLLSQGNLDLFMDMYPQTLAYRDGGIAAIQQMLNNKEIPQTQFNAWETIDQGRIGGNQKFVWDGNQDLLDFEQRVTLQTGIYARYLIYWDNVTNTSNFLVPAITSPIPGDDSTFQSFRAIPGVVDENKKPIAPNTGIGNFAARWAWVMQKQFPAYQAWSNANRIIDIQKLLSGGYK